MRSICSYRRKFVKVKVVFEHELNLKKKFVKVEDLRVETSVSLEIYFQTDISIFHLKFKC